MIQIRYNNSNQQKTVSIFIYDGVIATEQRVKHQNNSKLILKQNKTALT